MPSNLPKFSDTFTDMTPDEYENHRTDLRLSHIGMAETFGFHPMTSYKYAGGTYVVPPPLARLIRLMIATGMDASSFRDKLKEWAK